MYLPDLHIFGPCCSAQNWASDYENVSLQHGVSPPNPAVLLALVPSIFELCPDLAAGPESCSFLHVKLTTNKTPGKAMFQKRLQRV